jgi:predicted nucleic acid-binding protein
LFRIVEVTPALIQSSMDLAERHGLRGYDAVQLAGALEVAAGSAATGTQTTLVSSDLELNSAALVVGLRVEDPNAHP